VQSRFFWLAFSQLPRQSHVLTYYWSDSLESFLTNQSTYLHVIGRNLGKLPTFSIWRGYTCMPFAETFSLFVLLANGWPDYYVKSFVFFYSQRGEIFRVKKVDASIKPPLITLENLNSKVQPGLFYRKYL